LGAWDGNPERAIISYKTAIGQALLGHKCGDTVVLQTDRSEAKFVIISIEAAPPDTALSETQAATEAVGVE
jgi:transcription elongation GreA/GreB family factor